MLKKRIINAVVALALLVGVAGGASLTTDIDMEDLGLTVVPKAIAGHNSNGGGGG